MNQNFNYTSIKIRKPMKPKENKNSIVNFRVTDSQKQEIDSHATAMNLSVSGYLSHMISDYEDGKARCEDLRKSNIECMTQKEILEAALSEAEKDSELITHSSFTRFFESVEGKLVGNRLIKSKADLLGVLTSVAAISVVDDGVVDISIPLEVKNYRTEGPERDNTRWIYIVIAIIVCAALLGHYWGRRHRGRRHGGM